MALTSALGPNFLAIIILSLLVLLISRNPILPKEGSYSYYALSIAVLSVVILETFISVLKPAHYFPYSIFYSLSFAVTPMVLLIFAKIISPSFVKLKKKIFFIPFGIHLLVAVSNPFTGFYFRLSQNNETIRGVLFVPFLLLLCYAYILLYYASFKTAKTCAKNDRLYFYIPTTVAFICAIVQWTVPVLLVGWCGVAIGMFHYYTFMRELQHRYDPLTGVLNRAAFQGAMKKLQSHAAVTIAVFDLNRLKQINDNYGHSAGDKTISDMAQIIKKCFNGIGMVYRIGGDEFCLIAENSKKGSIEAAFAEVDELVSAHPDVHDVPFSIAYGYAEFDKKTSGTIFDCFDSADSMMYLNKRFIKGQDMRRKED